jgi:hypothetical protein
MTREVQLKDLKLGAQFMFLRTDAVFILLYPKDWRNIVGYSATTDGKSKLKEIHCSTWVREIC